MSPRKPRPPAADRDESVDQSPVAPGADARPGVLDADARPGAGQGAVRRGHDPVGVDTLDEVDPDVPIVSRRARRPFVAGGLAGMWALLVGLALVTCLVMLAWAISPNSAGDSAAAWNAAGTAWLGAHLVPLSISGQPVTLLPIGGLLLGLLLTRRSGAWTGRLLPEPAGAEVVGLVAGSALVYGSGGAGIAWLATGASTSVRPAQAFFVTAVVAALGTLWGVAREADLVSSARGRMSDAAWRTLSAGLAAVTGLVAVGALLVTVSLVRSFALVAQTMADLDGGPAGALGMTLLGALGLPNLDIWAMSVVVGPGFEIGQIGGLSAFGGEVGSLPALPVLAAIPTTVPGWAPLLLVVPVLMGALAGRIRWGRDLPTPAGAALAAVQVAGVVAVLIAGLAWLSGGSLGGGELAHVGPRVLPVTAAGTGLVVLGFGLEAAFQSMRLSWELHRAEQRATRERAEQAAAEAETHEVALPADEDEDELEQEAVDLTDGTAAAPGRGRSLRRLTEVPGMVGSFGVSLAGRVVSVVDVRSSAESVDLRGPTDAAAEAGTESDADLRGPADPPIEVAAEVEPDREAAARAEVESDREAAARAEVDDPDATGEIPVVVDAAQAEPEPHAEPRSPQLLSFPAGSSPQGEVIAVEGSVCGVGGPGEDEAADLEGARVEAAHVEADHVEAGEGES